MRKLWGRSSYSDSLTRHYASAYRYVGGYYGGCSEEAMMKALVENGPLSVSFEVYDDFMMYKTGVYHHTGALKSKQAGGSFDPFEVNQIISELCEDQTSILAS